MCKVKLKNPKRLITWEEPWSGLTTNKRHVAVTVRCTVAAEDVVKLARRMVWLRMHKVIEDEELLVEEWMTVHGAWYEDAKCR